MHQYYVYILANQRNGTLYTGVTNDLVRRVFEHKNKIADGFTKKYHVDKLVYFEITNSIIGLTHFGETTSEEVSVHLGGETGNMRKSYINSAIEREKQIKHWERTWKLQMIEKQNLEWKDLYEEIIGAGFPMSNAIRLGNDKENSGTDIMNLGLSHFWDSSDGGSGVHRRLLRGGGENEKVLELMGMTKKDRREND